MMIEVWVVLMPNGDRPFTRAMPPSPGLTVQWQNEGARIFRMTGEVPDHPEVEEKLEYPAKITEYDNF